MKYFWLIFSFYLLVLSWQPCQDLVKPINFHSNNLVSQTDIHDTQQEQNESDDCSPFCVCSCCQISVVSNNFHYPKSFNIQANIALKLVQNYKSPYENNFNLEIWQPPKSQA